MDCVTSKDCCCCPEAGELTRTRFGTQEAYVRGTTGQIMCVGQCSRYPALLECESYTGTGRKVPGRYHTIKGRAGPSQG